MTTAKVLPEPVSEALAQLQSRPELFLDRIDFAAGRAIFAYLDASAYRSSVFHALDQIDGAAAEYVFQLQPFLNLYRTQPVRGRPPHFIFHTAFCGSTLLARCLGALQACMSLREPYTLAQLAWAKRNPAQNSLGEHGFDELLSFVISLLNRTHEASQSTVIKQNSCCSNLIRECLAYDRGSKALFLYVDLKGFLASSLKTQDRRDWVNETFHDFLSDLEPLARAAGAATQGLSIAEKAAAIWLTQMSYLARSYEPAESLRIAALDCEDLMNEPADTLARVCEFLGLPASRDELLRAAGENMGIYSKGGGEYSPVVRRQKIEQELARTAAEIETALAYAARIEAKFPGLSRPARTLGAPARR